MEIVLLPKMRPAPCRYVSDRYFSMRMLAGNDAVF